MTVDDADHPQIKSDQNDFIWEPNSPKEPVVLLFVPIRVLSACDPRHLRRYDVQLRKTPFSGSEFVHKDSQSKAIMATGSPSKPPVWAMGWLRAAGVYNLVWGAAVIAFPNLLFDLC